MFRPGNFLFWSLLLGILVVYRFSYKPKDENEPSAGTGINSLKVDDPQAPFESGQLHSEKKTIGNLKFQPDHPSNELEEILKLLKASQFIAALELTKLLLKEQSTSRNAKDWLTANKMQILKLAGWQYINKEKDCREAINLLEEAAILAPKDKNISKGIVFCNHKLGKHDSAVREFYRYHENGGRDADIAQVVLDSFESLQKKSEGLKFIQSWIAESDSPLPQLEKIIDKHGKYSEHIQNFRTLFGQFLIVRYPENIPNDFASIALKKGDQHAEYLISDLGLRLPENQIEVTIFAQNNFQNIFDHSPSWASGLFDGRIRLPVSANSVVWNTKYENTLNHELVHALARLSFGGSTRFPTWWEEGLAQAFSCVDFCVPGRIKKLNSVDSITQKQLESSFLKLSKPVASSVYFLSLEIIRTAYLEFGIDKFRQIFEQSSEVDNRSSDALAGLLGYDSFALLLSKTKQRVKQQH